MIGGDARTNLYELLPEIFRSKDFGEPGQPLRTLFQVLQSMFDALEANIDELYDNWFIETCRPWLVPYIGALIGADDIDVAGADIWSARAVIANVIHWRARPGTLATIGQAASAATGWPAMAIDLADLVAAQSLTAPDPRRGGSARLTGGRATSADAVSYTAKVDTADWREPGAANNLRNAGRIGILLWRQAPCRLYGAEPGRLGRHLTFHQAGVATPLFFAASRFVTHDEAPRPADMPHQVTREGLAASLREWRSSGRGDVLPFSISRRTGTVWTAIEPANIRARRLDPDEPPDAGGDAQLVLVDPERGLFSFVGEPDIAPDIVRVDYTYGFGAPIGGGSYARAQGRASPERGRTRHVRVASAPPLGADRRPLSGWYADLATALSDNNPPDDLLIEIVDNASYDLPPDPVALGPGAQLAIQALDGCRPTIRGDLVVRLPAALPAQLLLSGLLWLGSITVDPPLALAVYDCTIGVQPPVAIAVAADCAGNGAQCDVYVARSIIGPVRMAAVAGRIEISQSILDGRLTGDATSAIALAGPDAGIPAPAPRATACTIIGDLIVASSPDLTDTVIDGTVRMPEGEWQPPVSPVFVSRRWGDPAYLQLADDGPREHREGAEDGGETGVYGMLRLPWRYRNLRGAINRYVPQDLSCAVMLMS